MKVIVLGATGGTGQATVQELLDGGHEVTAFSRHADAIDLRSDRLHTVVGDAMHAEEVERALEGQDAVVVALGVNENPLKVRLLHHSRTPVTVCSVGTRNVIAAMKKHGLRRLVVLSAYGVGDTRNKLPLIFRMAYQLFLKEQIADKELQERTVRESGLDWVIVQPVGLTNEKSRLEAFASTQGEARKPTVSRRSVARFLASAIDGGQYLGRTVALSS
ncbi:SDR family oxidoreductase [Myxococcaceae bacterium GXIMD 01537]